MKKLLMVLVSAFTIAGSAVAGSNFRIENNTTQIANVSVEVVSYLCRDQSFIVIPGAPATGDTNCCVKKISYTVLGKTLAPVSVDLAPIATGSGVSCWGDWLLTLVEVNGRVEHILGPMPK